MCRFFPLAVLLVAATLVGAQPVPLSEKEIRPLVAQLGSDEYADREAATKRLEDIGEAALVALRAGCKSESPEIVRRSQDVLRKIERRLANEKTLAPTLVELDAKDRPLDQVLADMSRQAKYEVILTGTKLNDLATKKVTLSTGGKLPFWEAVLQVCDAAEVQISSVAGFHTSSALPIRVDRKQAGLRAAEEMDRTVVLEARGDAARRPAAVYGAVLVEAVPFPKGSEPPEPSVLLQAWPEPRLLWQSTTSVKVTSATDATGVTMSPDLSATTRAVPLMQTGRDNLAGGVLIRNPDGTAGTLDTTELEQTSRFWPNTRQSIVRFKRGEKHSERAKMLSLTLQAMVRSDFESLSHASVPEPNQSVTGLGVSAVEMTAKYRTVENERPTVVVSVTYDPRNVQPAGVGDGLVGVKGGGAGGFGNQTVFGIRVADAEGKPYTLGLVSGQNSIASGNRTTMQMTLELHAFKDDQGPPKNITFWGTYLKLIDVPVVFQNVPLSRSK